VAVRSLDGFVRDARHPLGGELASQLRLGRQVEVGVEYETIAEELVLDRERLFDLDDHVGRPRLRRGRDDGGARLDV
jgi:hypothetical protein